MAELVLQQRIDRAMDLHKVGKIIEAAAEYQSILTRHPGHLLVTHLLGVTALQTGNLPGAVELLEKAVAGGDAPFQHYIPLVAAHEKAGRLDRAAYWQAQALLREPRWGDGYVRLAHLQIAQGQSELALQSMKQGLLQNPSQPASLHNNLGVVLDQLKRYPEAIQAYQSAIMVDPNNAVFQRNMGDAQRQIGDFISAERSYWAAALIDPAMGDAFNGIGLTLYHRDRFNEAIDHFNTALRLNPKDTNACMNLVLCYGKLGDRAATEATLRQAIALSPAQPELHSGLIMMVNYSEGDQPEKIKAESDGFGRRFAPVVRPPRPTPAADGRIRIGYVSPDFRDHAVAYFILPVLRHHDRSRFHITCYADLDHSDAVTEKIRSQVDRFRDITGLTDQAAAELVRKDGIDLLIDLAGHTVGNRLPMFALRPAALQATWLGYPNTTGLPSIDFRLTDDIADPAGVDRFYSEQLMRLHGAFFVYEPPAAAVDVNPLPMLTQGHVTFGSFNNISKITPAVASLWTQILQQVPSSRLIVAGITFAANDRLRDQIARDGVDGNRIEFIDSTPLEPFLELHHRVDLSLDTYPWAGHTTSLHGLWMGVPAITLAGPTAVSRAGASVLTNLGLAKGFEAGSPDQYVALAVKWANDPDALAAHRRTLRDSLRHSSLTNATNFTRNLEAEFEKMIGLEGAKLIRNP